VQQKQNIKGFTILELLVVITIVAVVSAVGYPNFMDWRKDREVRAATEDVTSMLSSINTQAQRGYFPLVQFYVVPSVACLSNCKVKFYSKGMSQDSLSNILNAGNPVLCTMTNSGTWNNHQVDFSEKKISVHIADKGAVCFSKDGSYFTKEGRIKNNLNVSLEGRLTSDYIVICTTENATVTGGKCATNQADGLVKPAYLVEWTRFGGISKFKWSGSVWTRL
jgi:prepilin-type N-terminal cleavage/methylation domain-containing protein|tara:strand:+ start:356 stop:1021 length:666 start_codon:yes stop_codon:yes gene_type:complete